MDAEELKIGKERVREHLIEPLKALGLKRKRSTTVADHEAGLDSVVNRLAYMREENLIALREVALGMAGGKAKNEWPAPALFINQAKLLQVPPPSDSPMVTSYMRSAAGRRAREGSYHVELYLELKAGRVPSSEWAMNRIREQARDNRRRVVLVSERQERGSAVESDAAWLNWYRGVSERAEALVPEVQE